MTKNITHKMTSIKLKAHLAMTAFVAVAVLTITLTVVGVFAYATLNIGVQPDSGQANVLVAPASVVAQISGFSSVQAN